MKKSTLKNLLDYKINDWLSSIDDKDLKDLLINNIIVSGGAIASGLMGDKINDYDIYFKSQEACVKVAEYYLKKADIDSKVTIQSRENSKGEFEDRVIIIRNAEKTEEKLEPEIKEAVALVEEIKKAPYRALFFSENAISLSGKIQLIVRFYGTPEEIHRNFDFVHAMCYYDFKERYLFLEPRALESMLLKTLLYNGSLYPVSSVFRCRKFIKRGWSISAGQMLKMMYQISDLDLSNVHVLREQLLGVDMAYMQQLLSALENREKGRKVDGQYLAKLIDEIFD